RCTGPRPGAAPRALAAALDANPAAKAAFDRLSYSNQRRLAEPIGATKSDETRDPRVPRAAVELTGGARGSRGGPRPFPLRDAMTPPLGQRQLDPWLATISKPNG